MDTARRVTFFVLMLAVGLVISGAVVAAIQVRDAPGWFLPAVGLVGLGAVAVGGLLWRFLRPGKDNGAPTAANVDLESMPPPQSKPD